jgi:hypothetical protein
MGTLSYHRRRPALAPMSLKHLTVKGVMENWGAVQGYLSSNGPDRAHPEVEALNFYLANAAYANVVQAVRPDEPLGKYEWIVEDYQSVVRKTSLRLFYYLLMICSRESRHVHTNNEFFARLQREYGCMDFTKKLRGQGSGGVEQIMRVSPPDLNLGKYTDHLVDLFDHGKFNTGYGGKAWGTVAKVLRDFVHGTLSAELMLDTGYTLAHNNGPIFNKGILYREYDGYEILKVLDVQRGGMIPQLVLNRSSRFVDDQMVEFANRVRDLFPDQFAGEVNWDTVKKLGAKGNYSNEKNAQKKAAAPKVVASAPSVPMYTVPGVLNVKKLKRAS